MNAKTLLEGLKCNYNEALHPTENQQKDMIRTLRNIGLEDFQLTSLYDWLLANCEYFPKVFDIHQGVNTLKLHKPGTLDQLELTRRELARRKEYEKDAISLDEWLRTGGYEFICEDCEYDETKIKTRLKMMNRLHLFRDRPKAKDHKSDFTFVTDAIPVDDFPSIADNGGLEVEFVDDLSALDDL